MRHLLLASLALLLLTSTSGSLPAAAEELPDSPCFACHRVQKKVFSEGIVHSPVAEADCGSCHKDHGATNKLILTEKQPNLCYGCHDEIAGEHLHTPVADGECGACHLPHNGPQKKLLAKASPGLCYDCHDDFGKKAAVHSPVAEGECLECHGAHKADRDALLTKNYDRERYVEFSERAYEMCFGCHDAKAFQDLAAVDATGFRDGSRNLHYLHVVGKLEAGKYRLEKTKKRMSCNGCHLVHGTDQEKLIRGSLERGSMTLYTIKFTRTETGGTCVVGCHKPQEYRQKTGSDVSAADAPSAPSGGAEPAAKAVN